MTRESGLPERVEILEVGPRDGLQNEKTPVSTADKVAFIERLAAAGLKRIEATSFVSPRRVPQMADAPEVMARVPRGNGVSYTGLVLSPTGAERAVAAQCDELGYAIVASETFAQRNQGRSIAETVADWRRVSAIARAAGKRATVTVVTAFGCPFEGAVAPERVADLVGEVMAEGPDEVCLADTIGVAVPSQVRDLFGRIAGATKDTTLRAHFHNTRNTGYANAYAAVLSGVTVLDASAGGVGGCPFAPRATGNIATEDLVYLLDGLGVASGVDGSAVGALEEWLEQRLGHPVPGQLGKAGFSAVAA